jgi:hypothetical protein
MSYKFAVVVGVIIFTTLTILTAVSVLYITEVSTIQPIEATINSDESNITYGSEPVPNIVALTQYDNGNGTVIYGRTYDNRLLKYNDTSKTWSQVIIPRSDSTRDLTDYEVIFGITLSNGSVVTSHNESDLFNIDSIGGAE